MVAANRSRWADVPNLITLARICAVPVIVWFMLVERHFGAFWLFVAAGLSDAVDGFVAKRFNAQSLIGGFLDPIADKTLLVSVYVVMGHAGALPVWLVIMVVFRDILILAGAVLFETVTHALTVRPLMVSKVNTTAQIVLAAMVLGAAAFGLALEPWTDIMIYTVGATTFLSGATYVVIWSRRASALERDNRADASSRKDKG